METTHHTELCPAADLELVEALRQGENWAFASLVKRHGGLMQRVASSYVRSPAVAEEIVQDTWMSVLRGIHSFEGRSTLKTWIFRILVNRAKTRGIVESRTVPFSSLDSGRDSEDADREQLIDRSRIDSPSDETPEQHLVSREVVGRALHAMEDLPETQRRVIALRDLQGCSSDEVCSLLGISGGNQRVQLHRARTRVRRELEAYLAAAA